jgi:hypothetical protein
VAATDADYGKNANVTFRLVDSTNTSNGGDSSKFHISPSTGMIKARQSLDYESQ